jgi:hypothetical protein
MRRETMTQREIALLAVLLTEAIETPRAGIVAAELLGLRRRLINSMEHERGEMPRAIADLKPAEPDPCLGCLSPSVCPTCNTCGNCRAY